MQITTNFDANTNKPTISKENVADILARDAIPSQFRYIGLATFVVSQGVEYQLVGGITNSDWELRTSGGATQTKLTDVSGPINYTNAIPEGSVMTMILINNLTPGTSPVLNIGESPGGDEIYDNYEVDEGMNIIDYKKYYPASQLISISGTFDGATMDIYITYQKLI